MNRSQILIGNAGAIIASCFYGASVVVTRSVVDEIPPLSLAVIRYGQGSIILLVILGLFRRQLLSLQFRDVGNIVVLSLFFFVFFPIAFNEALTLTTASRGSVMLATMPLWTVFLGHFSHREAPDVRQIAGVLLSIFGIVIVFINSGAGFGDHRAMIGNGLMLFSAFCGGVYGLLVKPLLTRYAAVTVTTYAMLIGALILLPFGLAEGLFSHLGQLNQKQTFSILYLGIFAGAIAYWLLTFALARLTPMLALAYINLNPMVAISLGVIFLNEPITWGFVLGFFLVAMGLLLANWPRARDGRLQPAVSG